MEHHCQPSYFGILVEVINEPAAQNQLLSGDNMHGIEWICDMKRFEKIQPSNVYGLSLRLQIDQPQMWVRRYPGFEPWPRFQVRQHLGRLPAINPATRTLILTGAGKWQGKVEKAPKKKYHA